MIQDVDRPDIGEVLPKMQTVKERADEVLKDLTPVLQITTNDNLCSSVMIKGSFDPKENWEYGIFQNSRYFQFRVGPPKGKRYYEGGEVTIELFSKRHDLPKMRKYTGSVEKALDKIKNWLRGTS